MQDTFQTVTDFLSSAAATSFAFVDIFVRSAWAQPLDYIMVLLIIAGCWVYVYLLKPKPNDRPDPYGAAPAFGFSLSRQEKRLTVLVLSITLIYVILRVLDVMAGA